MEGASGQKSFLLEGLLPMDVWNFIVVGLILFGVIMAVVKGVVFIRDEIDKRKDKKKIHKKDVTDEIADKVLEKLEPRFKDIEEKLDKDKNRLDNHEASIKSLNGSLDSIKDGMQVTADALTAILDHELHNGNSDQMQKARDELQKYTNGLIKKV